MKPKLIMIKSITPTLLSQLGNELSSYPSIRFFSKKWNGEYTLIVKCYNYYEKYRAENTHYFYGNYTYLYTCLSLMLTDCILMHEETILIRRILRYNYFYLEKGKLQKIANIANFILNSNSPLENSHELLQYRKQLILSSLLKHFHTTNYLQLDSFINFSLNNYYHFLEEIIEKIVELYIADYISIDYLNFVIKNMFE